MLFYLISTVISGLIVGFAASMIMNERGDFVKYIIIGIVGSALGSLICRIIGIYAYGTIIRLAVNVGGSCLLIYLIHKMGY